MDTVTSKRQPSLIKPCVFPMVLAILVGTSSSSLSRLRRFSYRDIAVKFTVEDFFDLHLQAPHFTLMACNSALQNVSTGDEPLGLITAILCAGASSVLGTLWAIQSRTARIFAKHFYTEFANSPPNINVFDLARASREAICKMKYEFDTREPYHWAGFVLHGSYFSRIPSGG